MGPDVSHENLSSHLARAPAALPTHSGCAVGRALAPCLSPTTPPRFLLSALDVSHEKAASFVTIHTSVWGARLASIATGRVARRARGFSVVGWDAASPIATPCRPRTRSVMVWSRQLHPALHISYPNSRLVSFGELYHSPPHSHSHTLFTCVGLQSRLAVPSHHTTTTTVPLAPVTDMPAPSRSGRSTASVPSTTSTPAHASTSSTAMPAGTRSTASACGLCARGPTMRSSCATC